MNETRTKLLLVDDESAITSMLAPFFERAGFAVTVAADGEQAMVRHAEQRPDIVVCDVLMPKLDGREVVRRLRAEQSWTPVILLTQVGEAGERALALDEGADDYVNKPFDPHELLSRVKAVLRRQVAGQQPLTAAAGLASGDLRVDRAARRVWLAEREVTLTPRASLLLDYLMSHPQELHTRERLLNALWGYQFGANTRAVDHRIAELRRELKD
ncbi:MAG: response regulator transcription factor, partial [Bifidobacteriaceae bacterium]|nr:response regulator transcription factor [Bifidobacteriaceae bacterium]